jgi:hypothetical protein
MLRLYKTTLHTIKTQLSNYRLAFTLGNDLPHGFAILDPTEHKDIEIVFFP